MPNYNILRKMQFKAYGNIASGGGKVVVAFVLLDQTVKS